MKPPLTFIIVSLAVLSFQVDSPADAISDLQSPDTMTRRAAIDAIQTLDDPRIPAACLPLLNDAGYSIRRQAARAIGSRFDQIPASQNAVYVQALKKCEAEGPDDVALLCQRAIGLLTHAYSYPPFSVSPDGKWVLYERRRLPVIADVKSGRHLLLSPVDDSIKNDPDRLLKTAATNESAASLFDPHWHPQGAGLAFTPHLMRRFYKPVCIWTAGRDDVTVLSVDFFKSLLGSRYHNWGTSCEFVRWDGDKVVVRFFDYPTPDGNGGEVVTDPGGGTYVAYDIRTRKISMDHP